MLNPLHTDLYQLSMLGAYFAKGIHTRSASFEISVRRLPEHRRFLVFAGLEKALDTLRTLSFCEREIDYLRSIKQLRPVMTDRFCEYLSDFGFRGNVWAMREGEIFFPGEPVLRVEATLAEAQLVETVLLSIINTATSVASKAARLRLIAGDRDLLEFGTRRTSPEEAIETARAAYIAGFNGTSNVEAGYRYDIPVAGTMAHSWVMAHETEVEALWSWADVYPEPSMLVDTYNTLEGVQKAIAAAGQRLKSIRIDSGNLWQLSREARAMLDRVGLDGTKILASGDLDEQQIETLISMGAPIDGFGIGTKLCRVTDAPALGGVYKLVELDGRPTAKLQEGKETLPGKHQVWRHPGFSYDAITLAGEDIIHGEALLQPVMELGRIPLGSRKTVHEIREFCMRRLAVLPKEDPYKVIKSEKLQKLIDDMKGARK